MKTLKGLNALPTYSEEHAEMVEMGRKIKMHPFKRMMRDAIATSLSKSLDDAEEREQVKLKLMLEDDEIQLEDAQFKILKEIVGANPCQWIQHYYEQVGKILKSAESGK